MTVLTGFVHCLSVGLILDVSQHVNDVQLHHRHHANANSDEDLEDFSDDETNTSSDDDRSSNGLEDSIMITSSNESDVNCEENKENHLNVNKLSKGELDSILAKTLLNTATLSSQSPGTTTPGMMGPNSTGIGMPLPSQTTVVTTVVEPILCTLYPLSTLIEELEGITRLLLLLLLLLCLLLPLLLLLIAIVS